MTRIWTRLWNDQRGAVSAVSALLLYTILVLGVTVGLVTLRNQIVQEFGDLSAALDHLDQSWEVKYSWGVERRFEENPDGPGPKLRLVNKHGESDPDGSEPAGISVREPALAEGEPFP